jgi:hypothetical protein
MYSAHDVRLAFPDGNFGSPASESELAEAERILGHSLPNELRRLYLEFDGFLGPTDSPFLFPVLKRPRPGGESLVTYTQFFRIETGMPAWLQQAVAVGDNGTGISWFLLLGEKNVVVRWDAEWEEYEPVDGNLLEDWCREKATFDSFEDEV